MLTDPSKFVKKTNKSSKYPYEDFDFVKSKLRNWSEMFLSDHLIDLKIILSNFLK